MKLKTVLSAFWCVFGFSAMAQAQGFSASIYWYDAGGGEPPISDACTGGTPFADGTATIQVFWDDDSDGPDADDGLAPLCIDPPNCFDGPPGSVNFNAFSINGDEQEFGTGYFASPYSFTSTGIVPSPARYYMRVCGGNAFWQSSVFTLTSGAHEVGPGLEIPFTFTCVDSVCAGCQPPPTPGSFTASTNRCDGVMLTWTYPSGISDLDEFRIVRNGSQITAVTDTSARSYLDTTASGIDLAYQIVAHKSCDAESAPAAATGTRLASPPTPIGVSATDNSCSQVVINWTYASNAGLERWVIVRDGVPVDSFAHSGQVPGARTYTHLNPPGGAALYCIYGSATSCGWGTGGCDSGQAFVVPAQVQGVNATDGNCGSTTIAWTDITDETGYQVYREDQGGGNQTLVGNVGQNILTLNDITSPAGTVFRYMVRGTNACGNGTFSAFDLGHRLVTPATPTGVLASDGTDCFAVIVSWANVTNELGFVILRDNVSIDSVGVDVLSYADSSAAPGTTYSYQVAAYNTCGNSTPSVANTGFRGVGPGQVTNVQATDTRCDSIVVTWNAVVGATLYRIRQDGNDVGTVTGTRFAHAPAPGTYSYTVTGESVCGVGPESSTDNGTRITGTPLPQVPAVSATDNNCAQLVITWGNIAGEDSFQIRRNGTRIGSVLADVLTFTDASAIPWTTYTYRVVGYNACGAGDTTGVDQGMLPVLPAQVTGVGATNYQCDAVLVSWFDIAGEDSFQVRRNGTRIGMTLPNVTNFADNTAAPGTTYQYTVVAYNVCGAGTESAPAAGVRLEAPGAPAWVDASDDTCGYVRINWGAAGGAVDWYLLFRNGVQLDSIPADTTDYVRNDTPPPGTYLYCIRAHSNNWPWCPDGPQVCDSGRVHATPGTPTNLAAGPVVCDQVNLTWNAAVGEVAGYIIYRDGVNIDSTASLSFADTGVNNMASHNYVVHAYNNFCGQGTSSNQVTGRARELLLLPTLPNDTLLSGDTITVAFDHCPGVQSDSVFVSVNNGAYQFSVAFAPVQASVNIPVPVVPQTVGNNRFKIVSTRNARRDSVITAPFVILSPVAVDNLAGEVPAEFFLDQNYPNPFNPTTTIRFGVPHTSVVTIEVYDVTGRKAATLLNEPMQPGVHSVDWNCSQCPSGMYILRMQTDEKTMMRKMLLMK